MEWFKNFWKKIQESNDNVYIEKIAKQKEDIRKLGVEIANITHNKEELLHSYNISIDVINELRNELNTLKPVPVEAQGVNDYFKEKKTKYRYKPNKRDYLHKTLENFSKDEEYISKYFAFMQELGLKDNYSTVDKCVYDVIIRVQKYINKTLPDDYNTDLESFGAREYWLTPREAFDYYVEEQDVGDCEDTSAFLYGCIMSVLITYQFNNETWRLLRTDINFPVGHAVCIWLKSNHVWACIESTYGESRFSKNWVRDKDMFRGVYTGIWHIFNEKTEYELK